MNKYVLVQWPESQYLMEHERFHECLLVQDIDGHDEVGSSAYMCPEDLYKELASIIKNYHLYKNDGYPKIVSIDNISVRAFHCIESFCRWKEIDPRRISIKVFTDTFPAIEVLKTRGCGIRTLRELNDYFVSKGIQWKQYD